MGSEGEPELFKEWLRRVMEMEREGQPLTVCVRQGHHSPPILVLVNRRSTCGLHIQLLVLAEYL
jgi:hypothetical protein